MNRKHIVTIRQWLNSRGGRTVKDLRRDIKGRRFVVMHSATHGEEAVYLPEGLKDDTRR